MYIDKVLIRFKMEDSKKGFLFMSHGVYLSKKMYLYTESKRDKITRILYALITRSIMYVMLCIKIDVSYV